MEEGAMSVEYDERREDDEEQGPGHVEPDENPTPDEQEKGEDDEQGPGHVQPQTSSD
jgi:hypothetical protein